MTPQDFLRRHPKVKRLLAGPLLIRRAYFDWRLGPSSGILSRLSEYCTADLQLRVKEFDGEFLLSPASNLTQRLLSEGTYEPELVRIFASLVKPDRDVVDVGANVGFFSVLAAKRLGAGKVLAAEPTAAARSRLVHNLRLNQVEDKVIVFGGLVSDAAAERTINVIPGREEFSSMGKLVHPVISQARFVEEKVPAETLDSLIERHGLAPGLIKVDVEGAEGLVFAGAQETLRRHRPVVISEFSRPLLAANGSSPEQVLKIFERCGYEVKDLNDPGRKPGSRDFSDIIAVPRADS